MRLREIIRIPDVDHIVIRNALPKIADLERRGQELRLVLLFEREYARCLCPDKPGLKRDGPVYACAADDIIRSDRSARFIHPVTLQTVIGLFRSAVDLSQAEPFFVADAVYSNAVL